ncbi:unnamed protein product [Colias eurytheme]|nr:unnamed protein product [Colias eurytheme]
METRRTQAGFTRGMLRGAGLAAHGQRMAGSARPGHSSLRGRGRARRRADSECGADVIDAQSCGYPVSGSCTKAQFALRLVRRPASLAALAGFPPH